MKNLFDTTLSLKEAEELIKNGADVNEEDFYGYTPLFFVASSVSNDNIEVGKLLIKYGADVNHRNSENRTPLFFANTIDIFDLFIQNNADLNVVDHYGINIINNFNSYVIRKHAIENGALPNNIDCYKNYRDLFSKKQQVIFDLFASITNDDNEFFQMCKVHQNDIKNNVIITIQDMHLSL